MRYRREIEVEGEPVEVFAYLADFEHAAEWDPGIVEARRRRRRGRPESAAGSR